MKQLDFRDVPDELWKRIEPLLAPFKRKRSGGSKPLAQRTVLAGILYKCRTGCQWAMLPACYGSKSTVHEHFQRWNKAGVMAEIFCILLAEYGKSRRGRSMAGYGRHLAASSDALSKNQRLRASDAIRRIEGEVAAKSISMWMVKVFLWE